jgi:hypothetical protein
LQNLATIQWAQQPTQNRRSDSERQCEHCHQPAGGRDTYLKVGRNGRQETGHHERVGADREGGQSRRK